MVNKVWQQINTSWSTGDMMKSVYDTDNNGTVDSAESITDWTITIVPSNVVTIAGGQTITWAKTFSGLVTMNWNLNIDWWEIINPQKIDITDTYAQLVFTWNTWDARFVFRDGFWAKDIFCVRQNGRVGIWTISPASIFHTYQNDSSTDGGITIEQDWSWDAIIQYLLTWTERVAVGLDNSDLDKYKVSFTGTLDWACFELDQTGRMRNTGWLFWSTKSADYTLETDKAGKIIQMTNSTPAVFTVPPNASAAFNVWAMINIEQHWAWDITFAWWAGVTINSKDWNLKLWWQWSWAYLRKMDTDEWILVGDLTS